MAVDHVLSEALAEEHLRLARVDRVLHEGLPPRQAVLELLRREPRAELDQGSP